MFNLLKSDFYRLAHGKALWVVLIILAASAFGVAALLAFVSSPQFADLAKESGADVSSGITISVPGTDAAQSMGDAAGQDAGASAQDGAAAADAAAGEQAAIPDEIANKEIGTYTESFGSMYVNGGFMAFLFSLFAALVLAQDFTSGFAKCILIGRSRRMAYYAEKLVLLAVFAAVFVAVGALAVAAAFPLAGWSFTSGEGAGEIATWAVLLWLSLFGYGALTAVVAWGMRSKVAGVLFAVLVPLGTVSGIVAALFGMVSPVIPALEHAASFLPYGVMALLGGGTQALFGDGAVAVEGVEPIARAALVMGVCAIAGAALALTACRRKDV